MATETKKYLDLDGLKHLLTKLDTENRIIKHPTGKAVEEGAYKIEVDANGHVIGVSDLTPGDIGAAVPGDIGDGKLTIKANGTEKGTFTANQAGNTEIDITAADLGLASALSFAGTTLTALTDGATTNPIKIKQSSTDTTGKDYTAISGNVVLYNNKEFI
jgi:hypothetical protein